MHFVYDFLPSVSIVGGCMHLAYQIMLIVPKSAATLNLNWPNVPLLWPLSVLISHYTLARLYLSTKCSYHDYMKIKVLPEAVPGAVGRDQDQGPRATSDGTGETGGTVLWWARSSGPVAIHQDPRGRKQCTLCVHADPSSHRGRGRGGG